MRVYARPEIKTEYFIVEDVITDSSNPNPEHDSGEIVFSAAPVFDVLPGAPVESSAPASGNAAAAQKPVAKLEVYGTIEGAGSFNQEITGGSAVQEGLNNIYENFLSKF